MRDFNTEFQRLQHQVRAKASLWRHAQPNVADFNRTVKSWRGTLEDLDTLSGGDTRVKAALAFIDSVPYEGAVGKIAAKSAADLHATLSESVQAEQWLSAGQRATRKALEFRSEWESGDKK